MSEPSTSSSAQDHPIGLIVSDDRKRSRLTVFFRLLLVIPHLIWLSLWGIVAEIALIVAWFAALITGRVPDGLHDFMSRFLRYSTRVTAYCFLLANPYPPFGSSGSYPVDARIDPSQPQSRLTVFFRIVIAIPALLLAYVFRLVNQVVAVLGWFYCLATGRMHDGLWGLSAWLFRFELQTYAYLFLLTGRYPAISGAPGI
jgi:hypothetical protein